MKCSMVMKKKETSFSSTMTINLKIWKEVTLMEIIEFEGTKVPASYLGDGVYAIFDGYGIWLHANDHKNPTDRIYLEPTVFSSLVGFDKEVRSPQAVELIKQLRKGGK